MTRTGYPSGKLIFVVRLGARAARRVRAQARGVVGDRRRGCQVRRAALRDFLPRADVRQSARASSPRQPRRGPPSSSAPPAPVRSSRVSAWIRSSPSAARGGRSRTSSSSWGSGPSRFPSRSGGTGSPRARGWTWRTRRRQGEALRRRGGFRRGVRALVPLRLAAALALAPYVESAVGEADEDGDE